MTVIDYSQVATARSDSGFLLRVELGHLLRLLALRLLAVGFVFRLCCHQSCGCQRLVGQFVDALDGAVHVAYLIDQRRHHLLCLEHLSRQHVGSNERTVLAHRLMELLGVSVEFCLQLLILACGGLAVPVVLLGAVLADKFHIAIAVLIYCVVGDGPESGHRADATELVAGVHHHHAVAPTGQVHTAAAAHAVDEGHGGLAGPSAVVNHHLVVVTARCLSARRIDEEQMTHHLRNLVGIHHLVAEVFRAIRAAVAVAGHGTVHHHHVDNLVILLQFLVVPVQVTLYAVDVADVQLILEVGAHGLAILLVALLRQEVAVLLLDVVRQMQLDGVLQRVGIRLCKVRTEVPYLIVHDV